MSLASIIFISDLIISCCYLTHTWQGALWSPTDGTDSHRVFYTNIMISYHLLVITWLGALCSPTDSADSHRAFYLAIKILTAVHNSMY